MVGCGCLAECAAPRLKERRVARETKTGTQMPRLANRFGMGLAVGEWGERIGWDGVRIHQKKKDLGDGVREGSGKTGENECILHSCHYENI